MANPKNAGKARSRAQLARDRRLGSKLYLEGKDREQIAEILNVSPATVSRDLKQTVKKWDAASAVDILVRREQVNDVLRLVEDELWEAHKRSKNNAKIRAEGDKEQGIEAKPASILDYSVPTRYLEKILKVAGRRARLYGLDAPKKVKLSGTVGLGNVELTTEERKAALEAILGGGK